MIQLGSLDALVLAGGLGTRLGPLATNRPKVMMPINGTPFLHYLLEYLHGFGIRRVVLALGHLAEAVTDYTSARSWNGLEIVTSVESAQLGTGGSLRFALPLLRSAGVLVLNGDSFVRADLNRFAAFHESKQALISLLLTYVPVADRYGSVTTDAHEQVTSFREKYAEGPADGFVNAGVYLMARSVIEAMPEGQAISLEKEIFPAYCGRGLYGMKGRFPFIDIGTPESYRKASLFFGGGR